MDEYLQRAPHLVPLMKELSISSSFDKTAAPEQWVHVLRALTKRADDRKNSRKPFKAILYISLVLLLLSIILSFKSTLFGFTSILFITGVIIGVVGLVRYKRARLPTRVRELLLPIVTALNEDMKQQSPLRIKIDTNSALASHNFQQREEIPRSELPHRTKRRTNERYLNTWLTLSGKLVDQTNFEIVGKHDVKQAKIKKLSASGKTKHKTKQKHKSTLMVTLKPPKNSIPQQPTSTTNGIAFEIKQKQADQFSIITSIDTFNTGLPSSCVAKADEIFNLFAAATEGYKLAN